MIGCNGFVGGGKRDGEHGVNHNQSLHEQQSQEHNNFYGWENLPTTGKD